MIRRLPYILALCCMVPCFVGCGTEDGTELSAHSSETVELRVTARDIEGGPLTLDPTRNSMRVEFDQSEGPIDFSQVLLRGFDGQVFDLESRLDSTTDIGPEQAIEIVFESTPAAIDGVGEMKQYQQANTGAQSGIIVIRVFDEDGNFLGYIVIRYTIVE